MRRKTIGDGILSSTALSVESRGNGDRCSIVGKEKVEIKLSNGGTLVLKDVRHISELQKNLIFISGLDHEGYFVAFGEKQWKVIKGSMVVARGERVGTLYTLSGMKNIQLDFCEGCVYGKQKRVSFQRDGKEKKIQRLIRTVKRTPQENGLVERMNGTIKERARCMRIHADLPLETKNLEVLDEITDTEIGTGDQQQVPETLNLRRSSRVRKSPDRLCLPLDYILYTDFVEVEYVAVIEASKEIIWLQRLLTELGYGQVDCKLWTDSQSAIHLVKNSGFHSRTKHIQLSELECVFVKCVKWVRSSEDEEDDCEGTNDSIVAEKSVKEQMYRDFLNPRHGENESVAEYEVKFTRLSRYGKQLVTSKKDRVQMFTWGLKPSIRLCIVPVPLDTYIQCIYITKTVEDEARDYRERKDTKVGKRDCSKLAQSEMAQGNVKRR
ncbi:hypothetical protein RJ639_014018 [Escallonia herrerae]|uniref:Retrovirus-related Pol polyprotein from transposon TNT 1-94-like beta-barrel domain-containing protein n=1 Tax=Escallonia herrerae TaxID=1293975 RepID=A0AA88VIY5_9ASTE|nr:hypothetical protein RJ639_014018 [Escallonia herrerae]